MSDKSGGTREEKYVKYNGDYFRSVKKFDEENIDYLDYYREIMDFRVANDAKSAPVDPCTWEDGGKHQFDFLKVRGLMKYHKLMDLGCGTLSLGDYAIPYLDVGNYVGIDISIKAIEAGKKLVGESTIDEKAPVLIQSDVFGFDVIDFKVDYIMAFSVFNHLEIKYFAYFCKHVKNIIHGETKIFLTICHEPVRNIRPVRATSYQYSLDEINNILKLNGFGMKIVDTEKYWGRITMQKGLKRLKLIEVTQ